MTSGFDVGAQVRMHVQRSCQSPFYSLFREEATRELNAKEEAKLHSADVAPRVKTALFKLPYFPFRNDASSKATRDSSLQSVGLIGATGFFGKFVAEQYLNRGISVSVLARDVNKAKSLFVPLADGEREQRHKASLGFVKGQAAAHTELVSEEDFIEPITGMRVVRFQYKQRATASPNDTRSVILEIVEGDLHSQAALEHTVRGSSVVYYLASAIPTSPNTSERNTNSMDGFVRSFDACRRVDAHFVALTPLWVHASKFSPVYWYRRMTYPRGYCRAVMRQEQNLLSMHGEPSPRCYFGPEDDNYNFENDSNFRYWWNIMQSTTLPEDLPHRRCSPVRFTLFRLSDLVYPTYNENMIAVKNNCVDNNESITPIRTGDLDARLLANVLAKVGSLCTSVLGSRIDVAGRLKEGISMKDSNAVLKLFDKFRDE